MPFNVSDLVEDPVKVRDGVVLNIDSSMNSWVRITPVWGYRYKDAWKECTHPYRRLIMAGKLPERTVRDLHLRAMALGVLIDWNDLQYTDENGVEQEVGAYTAKKAYTIFKKFPGFAIEIEERARDWSNFR
jgi:hypothetical protein